MAGRLQDDLISEFREEKKLIYEQIDLFNPMALALRKPVAQHLAAKGLIIIAELICWLMLPAAAVFAFFLNKLSPFYLLFQLRAPQYSRDFGPHNAQYLLWCFYGMIALVALLFLFLARALARIRRKNDVLSIAGRDIKTMLGQQLTRKAAIDAIEQRHFMELPVVKLDVNEVPNLGYDGNRQAGQH